MKGERMGEAAEILDYQGAQTDVDSYWGHHTVNSKPFKSADQSLKYLEWRSSVYPLFKKFMGLYGTHENEVILDYGCGPGNDVVGFSVYSKAKKVIGIDASPKALALARDRLALHNVPPARVQFIHLPDSVPSIPLENESVDYVHCAGVLHHTSHPEVLLKEFFRIMKPRSRACIMIYNADSLWLHLHTAYERMIVQNAFPGIDDVYVAFSKNVDGEDCPIARCYTDTEFSRICNSCGFETQYLGGYLSDTELKSYKKYRDAALQDDRLAPEHKAFIQSLTLDPQGYPIIQKTGKHAGIGGVYNLTKK
jgi:ubiquinone/menaquinone biosynthesis C-methylase UbiE